ncbi:phosphohydrolase, partial [Candidatus Peregrinibacteria bacterium CG22_combo_CG10-13_8_21_14_all_49_11]
MSLSKNIVDRTLRTKHGEHAYKVVERLTDAGHDAWWVGGCVRDMLLGQEPSDIDIATSALPNEIIALFDKVDVQGKEWGSLHVTVGKEVFHITMFREDDAASDGRRPEAVVFGSREQDALRRDITVNAVYFHPITRELYDPCGGEKDLQEKLIRFIGDPALRIKHDALRMLRVVRFRALLDGQYHPETFIALKELASHIEILSGSRRLEELDKILLGPHSARALEDLWELNILEYMLPELYACKGVPQPADYHHEGDVWEHMLLCTKGFTEEHGKDVRLAVLFHDCGKA